MKKKYIQPNVSVRFVVVESLLTGQSKIKGIDDGPGEYGGGLSKPHEVTDDSFDNIAWPKSKSPWED